MSDPNTRNEFDDVPAEPIDSPMDASESEDQVELDPLSPLNLPTDPWFDRFNKWGDSNA